jgi:hypothetical protein
MALFNLAESFADRKQPLPDSAIQT